MILTGSIYDPKFKATRGYLCGSFDGAPVFSEKIEVGHMDYDELEKHIGNRHHHDLIDEMTIILKGGITEKIGSEIFDFKEGDFFFLSPGTITELKKVEKGTSLLVIKGPSEPKDKIND